MTAVLVVRCLPCYCPPLDDDHRQRILSARSSLLELQYPYGFLVVPDRIDGEVSRRVRLQEQVQQLWKAVLILIVVERTLMMTTVMELSLR